MAFNLMLIINLIIIISYSSSLLSFTLPLIGISIADIIDKYILIKLMLLLPL